MVFFVLWFTSGLVMGGSTEENGAKITHVVMNVAIVGVHAMVCLVINCQMAIHGHPPSTGNGSDWTVVC